jgi:UDP-N-acetylglucosamine transferase subunit ALG13
MNLLLVASGGGHLKQLWSLAHRLEFTRPIDRAWVTYETPQAASLLAGERVTFAHHPTTRNLKNAVRNAQLANRLLRGVEPGVAISTGAGVAVPFLAVAAARGWRTHYVESATRVSGPSLSGRLLSWVPAVQRYTQYASWHRRGWHYAGSVFDGFSSSARVSGGVRSLLVSLGTHELFPFDRLVEKLERIVPPTVAVEWQTGSTSVDARTFDSRSTIPSAEFEQILRSVDVVVAHCGTGIALAALEAGKCPVLVPRRPSHHEHVDDHQLQLAEELRSRGLAIISDVEDLSLRTLEAAARRETVVASPASFRLRGAEHTSTSDEGLLVGQVR